MGANRSGNRDRSKSAGSNSTRVRKRLDASSPCSSAKRMLPLWRKINSAIEATIPLRSGQETIRVTELVIPLFPERFRDLARSVGTRAPRQTRPGMRSVAAQIKVLNGCSIARPVEQRTHGEELIERELTVEDMAAGKAVGFFEILGGDDLVAQDDLREIRRVLRDRLHHGFPERRALAFPVAVFELVRRVLHIDRHYLLPGRGE